MKFFPALSLLTFSLFFSSCSTITKEDCSKDMKNFGLEHGRIGYPNLLEEVRNRCPGVDLASYQTGFENGWKEYCTPFNGYRMGTKGDAYKSYCPREKETLFHEKFLIGKKVYEKKDQVRDLQEKIMDLSEDGKNLTNPSSHDELTKLKSELRDLNAEIQSLEQLGMSPVHTN